MFSPSIFDQQNVSKNSRITIFDNLERRESFRDYVKWFTQSANEVPHVNHDLLVGIMQQNL